MTTIVRRTKGILTPSKGKSHQGTQNILDELRGIQSSLAQRISETKAEYSTFHSLAEKWVKRSEKADLKKSKAKTGDGAQAMEILYNQAKRYAEFYTLKKGKAKTTWDELDESYKKISNVILGLDAVEQTKELDEKLRQMASEDNIELSLTDDTLDMRAIAQATHTAKALLELQTSR